MLQLGLNCRDRRSDMKSVSGENWATTRRARDRITRPKPRMPAQAVAVLAVLMLAAAPAQAGATRPLYVFAPSADDPRLATQRATLASAAAGLAEREMPAIVIAGDSVAGSGARASALRARFGIAVAQFRVILVGKDGGVKLSSPSPVTAATLFSLVDAMPMRRQETKERGR